jgi:hypothetical protein
MKPMAIRSLGAVAPSRPRAEAGMNSGMVSAAAAIPAFFKKLRREVTRGRRLNWEFVVIMMLHVAIASPAFNPFHSLTKVPAKYKMQPCASQHATIQAYAWYNDGGTLTT